MMLAHTPCKHPGLHCASPHDADDAGPDALQTQVRTVPVLVLLMMLAVPVLVIHDAGPHALQTARFALC